MVAGLIQMYEVNYRCKADGSQYIGIVKWLGPFGGDGVQFIQLGNNVTGPGLRNGDYIAATAIGNTITAYINGVQVAQQVDNIGVPYLGGNPGIGHWLHLNGASGVFVTDYGHLESSFRDL